MLYQVVAVVLFLFGWSFSEKPVGQIDNLMSNYNL